MRDVTERLDALKLKMANDHRRRSAEQESAEQTKVHLAR